MRALTILIILAAATWCCAQPAVTFTEDNFTAAQGFRQRHTKDNNQTKLEGGKLIVENGAKENMYWAELPYHFYRDSVSYFEMDLKLLKQDGDYGYGILWHTGNYDYECWITTNGFYMIRVLDSNSEKKDLMNGFIEAPELKHSAGATNKFGVECRRGLMTVYINGKKKVMLYNGDVYKEGVTKVNTKLSSVKTSVYTIGIAIPTGFSVQLMKFSSLSKPHVRRINLIDNPNQGYKKENLGPKVNTRCNELDPRVSADDKNIYFSVRECDVSGTNPREDDDLFYSVRDSGGSWIHFKKMPYPFNNESNNGMVGISGDNNTIYYNTRYKGKTQKIWLSQKKGEGKWDEPQPLNLPVYTNRNQYSGHTISANRKILISYFEDNNSIGNTDLYVSFSEDGINFTGLKSLGAVVNTPLSEFGAYLAPDNKTLYFASYGHGTYGGADIFVTKREDESWTKWSTPKNLGPEINTESFDAYFSIIASGKYAYMVSDQHGTGGKSDIVRIPLPYSAQPDPVVIIKGRVLDAKTKKPLHSEVVSTLLKTNTKALVAFSDSAEGKYQIILPAGELYDFLANKKGYYANSQHIDLSKTSEFTEMVKDIYLQPIDEDTASTIHLNNVFFVNCSDTIKAESYAELDRLAKFMKTHKDYSADIDQFMDKGGECADEETLADKRAQAIKNYLIKKGIPETRLKHKSHVKHLAEKMDEHPEKKNYIVPKENEPHGHIEIRFVKKKAKKVYHVRKPL